MSEQEKEVVEKGNDLITVYKNGQAKEVTRKAFNVHYAPGGYTLENGKKEAKTSYTLEELQALNDKDRKKVTNDQYKEAFTVAGIDFKEDATKSEFIGLIPND